MFDSQNLEFWRRWRSRLKGGKMPPSEKYQFLKKHQGDMDSVMNFKWSKVSNTCRENLPHQLTINQYIAFLCKMYLFWVENLSPSQLNKHYCIYILSLWIFKSWVNFILCIILIAFPLKNHFLSIPSIQLYIS
jgi:hypothetical protein